MVDHHSTVCCMCGDVGFPEKLFRCTGCKHRFQHSYCSNYYEELPSLDGTALCDWCQSKERSPAQGMGNPKSSVARENGGISKRSEYSGDKIKRGEREESSDRGKNVGSAPSPRRRYKFLKDVMC